MPNFNSSTLGKYTSKWLIGTGIFELALAGGFIVGGAAAPEARFGLFLTAAILGSVGLGLIVFGLRSGSKAAEAQRVLTAGTPGTATVTGLTQTGMFLNDNPQVEMDLLVQLPGRTLYAAKRREFVPLILLGRLSTGAPLAVKVDPSDPNDVVIDWEAPVPSPGSVGATQAWWGPGATQASPETSAPAASGLPAAWLAGPAGNQTETLAQVQAALEASGVAAAKTFAFPEQQNYAVDQLRQFLRTHGKPGTATIDQLQDTGVEVGDEHLYVMETTVNVPGSAPHKTGPSAAMVPKKAVGKLALGQTLPVMVAADNPDMVMFEWEKIV